MRRSILRSAGTRWLAAAVVAGTALGGTTAAAHAEPKPQRELPSSGCEADLPPERKPIPGNPLDLLPRLPDRLSIPLPYPRILPVPEPAPEKPVVRIPSEPPPKDPCSDPCPDITDPPKPKPGAGGPALSLEFPKITLDPAPKNIPVPVPNPNRRRRPVPRRRTPASTRVRSRPNRPRRGSRDSSGSAP